MSKRVLIIAVLGLVLLTIGCASKPEAQLAAAQKALEGAEQAEAVTYAPTELQKAQDTMASAQAEIKVQDDAFFLTRSYEQATTLLTQVVTEAGAAAQAATDNKEKVKQEAEALKGQLAASITEAEEMLAKAPKGKGTKADLEALQGDLAGAKTAVEEASAAFDQGQYMSALDQLKNAATTIDGVKADIEAAIAKKGRR